VIISFADDETARVFQTGKSRKFGQVAARAARRLADIDFANKLEELRNPPGNRLERLKGNREGQHSIRINDQCRVCFRWLKDGAHEVQIVDYH
jgi:proteic killer suppression protein